MLQVFDIETHDKYLYIMAQLYFLIEVAHDRVSKLVHNYQSCHDSIFGQRNT